MTEKKQPSKTSPIAEHKEKDVKLLRKTLLSIIKDDNPEKKTALKDKIDAAKLLARMHHALQIDKSVTAKATAQQVQSVDNRLAKGEAEEIKALLDA